MAAGSVEFTATASLLSFTHLDVDMFPPRIVGVWCALQTDAEIAAVVETKEYYIAGFTDSSVAIREDLYDLYVDGTV